MSSPPDREQPMFLVCPNCRERIQYLASPRFCSSCGHALSARESATTVEHTPRSGSEKPPSEAQTLLPAMPGEPAGEDFPETVGNYRLLRRLGTGGMGTVFEAAEISSGRHVALKLVGPQFASSRDSVERFREEGRLASMISHPRCVFVLAADEDQGRPYIVMELMPGGTLNDLVRQNGPLPPEQAIRKILDVIDGLNEAHEVGLIHRDVKPGNCFLEADGRVKIGDFGLAKSLLRDSHLTQTGTFLGTPLFAAPEQIKCEGGAVQDDVYSVAATLYFLLTGQAPFQSGDTMATMARIVSEDPPSMRALRPDLPKVLDDVVLQGLARERKNRWRSLEQFRQALLHLLPAEVSVGGLGLRFGAFLLDAFLLSLARLPLAVLEFGALLKALTILAIIVIETVYFGLLEGLFGWSVGKRALGLRVTGRTTQQPPGVKRSFLRVSIFYLIPNLAIAVVALYLCVENPEHVEIGVDGPIFSAKSEMPRTEAMLVSGAGAWYVLASIALVVTMRKRNGFRGLHEFASGTHTYLVRGPEYRRRRSLDTGQFDAPLMQPDGLPEKVGSYIIRGAFRWAAEDRLLVAQDPQLGRAVWIWLRPQSEPALGETHRALNRTTRVRWLACGVHRREQWDAFLAPSGCPLPALVVRNGRLSWAEFRPILEHLTDELHESCLDNSLPQSLSLEQLWLSPKGQVQLLETSNAAVCEPQTCLDATNDQRRAMALLAAAAALALEGKPRPSGCPAREIQAPIPLHARKLLNGLLLKGETLPGRPCYQRVDEFKTDLKATEQRPREVSPWLRAKDLMGHTAYALFCLVPIIIMSAYSLDPGATASGAWQFIAMIEVPVLLAPAYLVPGGLSYFGIAIVLKDGRRASRLRCLARALAAWGFVAVLGLVAWVGVWYLSFLPWRTWTMPGLAVALFGGYVYLILRFPSRAPHDYLVGTRLVPK
ncbi:MAG: protein kinase domain-containing protein [Thermoguttaceae bacterium]